MGRSTLCRAARRPDDAGVPYQIAELMGGILLMSGLILSAALTGWLVARLILCASRPTERPEGRRGSEARS